MLFYNSIEMQISYNYRMGRQFNSQKKTSGTENKNVMQERPNEKCLTKNKLMGRENFSVARDHHKTNVMGLLNKEKL